MVNLEIKKQFDRISFDNVSDIIISKGLFFKDANSRQKLDQKIKTYNIFFDSITKILQSQKKIHLQVPESLSGDEISYFFDELSAVSQIRRSRIPSYIMLYKDNDVSQIAKRIIKKTLPAIAINVAINKISEVSKKVNFNFVTKEKSEYGGPKPSDIAIVIDKNFSNLKAEELHLCDYNVINIFKERKSTKKKEVAIKKTKSPITESQEVNKKSQEKLAKAEKIYQDLKNKASEFLHNAMSYKRKSDDSRKMIDRINLQNESDITKGQDVSFALKQCAIDESRYSSLSKDFLQLYEEINSQISDIKSEIKVLKNS